MLIGSIVVFFRSYYKKSPKRNYNISELQSIGFLTVLRLMVITVICVTIYAILDKYFL